MRDGQSRNKLAQLRLPGTMPSQNVLLHACLLHLDSRLCRDAGQDFSARDLRFGEVVLTYRPVLRSINLWKPILRSPIMLCLTHNRILLSNSQHNSLAHSPLKTSHQKEPAMYSFRMQVNWTKSERAHASHPSI